jgi:hypothetical protein
MTIAKEALNADRGTVECKDLYMNKQSSPQCSNIAGTVVDLLSSIQATGCHNLSNRESRSTFGEQDARVISAGLSPSCVASGSRSSYLQDS